MFYHSNRKQIRVCAFLPITGDRTTSEKKKVQLCNSLLPQTVQFDCQAWQIELGGWGKTSDWQPCYICDPVFHISVLIVVKEEEGAYLIQLIKPK